MLKMTIVEGVEHLEHLRFRPGRTGIFAPFFLAPSLGPGSISPFAALDMRDMLQHGRMEWRQINGLCGASRCIICLSGPSFGRRERLEMLENSPADSRPVIRTNGRSRITNGNALLPGVDGRSVWARRCRDVIDLH